MIQSLLDINSVGIDVNDTGNQAGVSTSFDDIRATFRWSIPESLNIAELVCTRHARGDNKLALIAENDAGDSQRYSFDEIDQYSNQLANVLLAKGVKQGDRVAVILPQRIETALLHIAAHKIGAVSLPLSILFGDDALHYRLKDSDSCLVLTNEARASVVSEIMPTLAKLKTLLVVHTNKPVKLSDGAASSIGKQPGHGECFWSLLARSPGTVEPVSTHRDDPAFLLYTSGTTGPPKGALIPHRALIGNLTGFEMSQNGFPRTNDCLYTPADWAWTGGLLDGLLPAWYYGVPVVGYDAGKFDAEQTASLMSRHRVTCAFIPPTALKMLRAEQDVFVRHPSYLRSVMSAGEAVGEELLHWGREALGIDINEMCGQTEHNYLMGNCSAIMPVKPGSMGKAYPGHQVAIMDENGNLLGANEHGEIVAHRDDPVHFLGYLNNPEATARKYTGDWFHTGDVGYVDDDGYLWFVGRADDVISSAGYRIGPGEIEDCALQHPAILQAAAIGVPDPAGLRGDVVKLCVVTKSGTDNDEKLMDDIRQHVRNRLAAYEYPRIIEFFDILPMTTTGKVKRQELRQRHIDAINIDAINVDA